MTYHFVSLIPGVGPTDTNANLLVLLDVYLYLRSDNSYLPH